MKVFLSRIADKYVKHLNEPDKGHVLNAIDGLEEEPPKGDIKPLAGLSGRYRLKTNKYRIFFRYEVKHILVTHIDSRGQAYNKKNMRRSKR